MKAHIIIDLNELTNDTKEELLNTLYHIEDQMSYKCKSVSKTIDTLQEYFKMLEHHKFVNLKYLNYKPLEEIKEKA